MILGLNYLSPKRFNVDIQGGGIEGGRNLLGFTKSIDYSGGGQVVASMELDPANIRPAVMKYVSRVGGIMNGGVRYMDVPLLLDFIVPVIGDGIPGELYTTGIPYGDEALHDDDTGFVQPIVSGIFNADAGLNAGTIQLRMFNAADLVGGEWFSVRHATRGNRAYKITDVDSIVRDTNSYVATVAIRPTIREEVTGGTDARFVRPLCRMRFAPGSTLPLNISGYWQLQAELKFIEAP